MAFKRTKKYVKKRYNPSKWLGISSLKGSLLAIKSMTNFKKDNPAPKASETTFEKIIQENSWTEKDIQSNIKYQKKLCLGFLAFAFILLILAIYLFITGNIFGGAFTIVFMLLGIAYSYQAWVSIEQLKQHKISIQVWQSFKNLFSKNK